jgi:hypothetical protein
MEMAARTGSVNSRKTGMWRKDVSQRALNESIQRYKEEIRKAKLGKNRFEEISTKILFLKSCSSVTLT